MLVSIIDTAYIQETMVIGNEKNAFHLRSTVKNAARFAVYDEMIINVKNHQIPPTIRVDVAYSHIYTHKRTR